MGDWASEDFDRGGEEGKNRIASVLYLCLCYGWWHLVVGVGLSLVLSTRGQTGVWHDTDNKYSQVKTENQLHSNSLSRDFVLTILTIRSFWFQYAVKIAKMSQEWRCGRKPPLLNPSHQLPAVTSNVWRQPSPFAYNAGERVFELFT
jgi:hypothetical protein